jgi:hypothetical protein
MIDWIFNLWQLKCPNKNITERHLPMTRIFVPSHGPDDWKDLLADPNKHWAKGYSARAIAKCWESAQAFPPEIKKLFTGHPQFNILEPLLIFPEWKVPLPGGRRPSQNDIFILASTGDSLVSITVEGKVSEDFDISIGDWQKDASPGKLKRLEFLTHELGLTISVPPEIRYQLLHRAASAIIEAKRFHASHAVMLVHSFSPANEWFEDFQAFASLFGPPPNIGHLFSIPNPETIPFHMAWVHGDESFLKF